MNYASTITAEAQDNVSADVAVGHDPHNSSSLRRNLLIAGGVLFALLLAIAAALQPGRELFMQSDVLEVIEPMVMLTELCGCFERPQSDPRPWRGANPLPVPTERERYVLEQNLPVYRVLFQRNTSPLPSVAELEDSWERVDNPAENPPPS